MSVLRLKIESLPDDKPVKVSVELPAVVYADLKAYAELLTREGGRQTSDPEKLMALMLKRFMASDRAFAKARRTARQGKD
jgi:hypothetical protein